MNKRALLGLTLPPLVIVTLLTAMTNSLQIPQPLILNSPQLYCDEPPSYRVGYRLEEAGLIPKGAGFQFQGLSWLETDLCTPGTLFITGAGDVAAGEKPVLDLTLDSSVLAREAFHQERTVMLRIPRKGRLKLGYFNDYYRSEARVAQLENLSMNGATCHRIKTTKGPTETGGAWSAMSTSAMLKSSIPILVTPCSSGVLSLQVLGQAGGGAYPVLSFKQSGRTLLNITTRETRQPVRLTITDEPLAINLTNPYFRQLADRNLYLLRLKFLPDSPY